ncbi:REP element-mobilizing transposase RayT [Bradyrhizobium sp. i1.7.7]
MTPSDFAIKKRHGPRLARVVIPGHPHHVTQRGNGRSRTFFDDGDYALYRDLLAANCGDAGVEVWAWCLMPNHVHLILVPSDPDGLRRALARVHRSYAGTIQARKRCSQATRQRSWVAR